MGCQNTGKLLCFLLVTLVFYLPVFHYLLLKEVITCGKKETHTLKEMVALLCLVWWQVYNSWYTVIRNRDGTDKCIYWYSRADTVKPDFYKCILFKEKKKCVWFWVFFLYRISRLNTIWIESCNTDKRQKVLWIM